MDFHTDWCMRFHGAFMVLPRDLVDAHGAFTMLPWTPIMVLSWTSMAL